MKKVIPVIIAVVLIIVIAGAGFGAKLLDKYSYSKERADLTEYFGVMGEDDVPVVLQDERIEEHAKLWDGVCYFDLATVHKYFNDRFYEDKRKDSFCMLCRIRLSEPRLEVMYLKRAARPRRESM